MAEYTLYSNCDLHLNNNAKYTVFTTVEVLNNLPGLYNWNAINTGGLAPIGWRIPTHSDWLELITFLGGDVVAGGKLKEVGFTNWDAPNEGATDEVGFTSIANGYRDHDSSYYGVKLIAVYWSSTPIGYTSAVYIGLSYDLSSAYVSSLHIANGLNIRCMTDVDPNTTTVNDIDGNIYDVIHIGNQWWFKQDLKTTRYNYGGDITMAISDQEWILSSLTDPLMCYYQNWNNDHFTYQLPFKLK